MLQKEIVIKPKPKWQLVDIHQLWRFRELFYIFIWRDIKVRYKQTFIGIAWVAFQPLLTTGIFTIFFGNLANIPSGNLPYHLFVFAGLVFWTFFSNALTTASSSLIDNVQILKKVYFPREILPISATLTSFIDFCINFLILLIYSLALGFIPHLSLLLLLPLTILIVLLAGSGIGLFLASFNVKYRDVRYVLPFFIQTLIFLTPVIYPTSAVRDSLRYLFALNPMTGVIESIRIAFSGSSHYDLKVLLMSLIISIITFLFGLSYFRKTERFFADIA